MNDRQAYAMAHPLNDAAADLASHQSVTTERDGNLLLTVLAVDR